MTHQVVLIRHGESVWNKENRFTGWTDVDLTDKGRVEALEGAKMLKEKGFSFDVAFTSVLKRAIRTLWIVLDELDEMWIPVHRSWRLNERHYGALQGLNKAEMAEKHGDEQVHIWRRSYDIPPPEIQPDDDRYPAHEDKYKNIPEADLPKTECLKDTVDRFLPYWHEQIVPVIKEGKRIVIAAHGNSLRALVKYLDGISDDEITQLNIPTGIPLLYELDDDLKPQNSYYLADKEKLDAAVNSVANQGKAK